MATKTRPKPRTHDEMIGNALRELREAAGLTQEQMVRRLGRRHRKLEQATLSNYERGQRPVPNRVVQVIERDLGLPPGSVYARAFGIQMEANRRTGWLAYLIPWLRELTFPQLGQPWLRPAPIAQYAA